jgi:acetyl-CoA C-acetyltransferase
MQHEIYIVSAVRTPIAAFRGSFKDLSSVDLGTIVAKEALKRAGKLDLMEESSTFQEFLPIQSTKQLLEPF